MSVATGGELAVEMVKPLLLLTLLSSTTAQQVRSKRGLAKGAPSYQFT